MGVSWMKAISKFLQEKEDIKSIIDGISSGLKEQLVAGLSGTARSLFITTTQQAHKKKTLVITHQLIHAQQLFEDLIEFSETPNVYLYPVNELIASEMAIASPEMTAERIKALNNWLRDSHGILIAPIAALKRILPPSTFWHENQLTFTDGEVLPTDEYLTSLVKMGYERVDMVTNPTEFSVRGGIIDVYAVTEEHPIRIELFDNEIDSIRYFDANTQRSLQRLTKVTIGPAKELIVTRDRKSTRLNSSHVAISYAVFCLKKKKTQQNTRPVRETRAEREVERRCTEERAGSRRRAGHVDTGSASRHVTVHQRR